MGFRERILFKNALSSTYKVTGIFCLNVTVCFCGEQKIVSNGNIASQLPDQNGASDPIPTPAAALTYNDVKSIIDANCSACHAGYASTASSGPSQVAADKAAMASAVEGGTMPKGNAGFKATANGQKLLSWLRQP